MTAVNSIASANSTPSLYATQPTRQPVQTMGAEQFMHLLVVQLQNQDPTSPMDTAQMVQQTTQLAMMRSMQDIIRPSPATSACTRPASPRR
ncbi:flagellar hook assembly protein [Leifsonia xyli subsp. xyli str. CTCB07]|uniref:Flagellar hook assembly protein n=1 Tax=Leifsonia xyli subsp. xyli (strain CTCB07) TaxID=281090 RepID=Q6AGA4_LEIXX|nr:flagellar hook assembly protein [Leifsonia xyli subsp. xyli str. CTCB07]